MLGEYNISFLRALNLLSAYANPIVLARKYDTDSLLANIADGGIAEYKSAISAFPPTASLVSFIVFERCAVARSPLSVHHHLNAAPKLKRGNWRSNIKHIYS